MIYLVGILLDGEHSPPVSPAEQKSMEVIYAVEAPDEAAALKIASNLSTEYESAYISMTGDKVSWRRNGYSGIWNSGVQITGSGELFGRILRRAEANSFRSSFEE